MDRYDRRLIAIAISKTMTCDKCPYKCKVQENSSYYNCENHWKKILDLIAYNENSDPHADPHNSKINDIS